MFKRFVYKKEIEMVDQIILKISRSSSNIYYNVRGVSKIVSNLIVARNLYDINYLIDLSSNHSPAKYKQFQLFYILTNLKINRNIVLLYSIHREVISLHSIYRSSDWLEREVFDLFGIRFINHPNLRRILTDYGFKGFPLRKDFPVFGYKEICYDFELRQVIYTGIKLTQNWRNYFFQRQWTSPG